MNRSTAFTLIGVFFLILGVFSSVVSIVSNDSVNPTIFTYLSLCIMSFCLSYLYPQYKQKDERMKLIRYKGMFISFFATVLFLIALQIIVLTDLVFLSATEILTIIQSFIISIVFVLQVFVAKRI